jgi:hypothetical protein
MRTGLSILSATLLMGCTSDPSPPQDCKMAEEQGLQCLERNAGKSDRQALLACFPFSPPERISGAWVFGFETNQFYEGEKASAAHLTDSRSDTALDPGLELGLDNRPRVYQVEFLGRRSKCDMGFPRNLILVERVDSKQYVAGPPQI